MDSDPYKVGSADLTKISTLQQYVGLGDVDSPLFRDEIVMDCQAHSRIIRQPMHRSGGNNEYTFTCNSLIHALLNTQLRQEIPQVVLKEAYRDNHRMAWTHNLGHNIIIEAVVKRDERPVQAPVTAMALDLNLQFFIAPADRPTYRRKIGTVPELINWSQQLPSYTLNIPQPFAFGKDAHKSIKKVILGNSSLVLVYKLRNKVTELLRLQERQLDGTWRNCSKIEILQKCDFLSINADHYLAPPELWATYDLILPGEKEFWQEKSSKSYHDTFINEIIPVRSGGGNGNDLIFRIEGPYAARAMFWLAQNSLAAANNNYSNYTDDGEDLNIGHDPVTSSSFNRDNVFEWKDLPSDHNNIGLETERGIYIPDEPGYHCHIWGMNMARRGIDLTVDFTTASQLNVTIGATDTRNFKVFTFIETLRFQRYQVDKLEVLDSLVVEPEYQRASRAVGMEQPPRFPQI